MHYDVWLNEGEFIFVRMQSPWVIALHTSKFMLISGVASRSFGLEAQIELDSKTKNGMFHRFYYSVRRINTKNIG